MPSHQDGRNGIDDSRRTVLKAFPLAGLVALGSTPVSAAGRERTFPEEIPLPTGFQPEGIAIGRRRTFFVGSLAGGAIYSGDLRTGDGDILVPAAEERVAVGLSYDCRSNYLFVAGGPSGEAFVYDATTGETVANYELTDPGSFVNDVVVTRTAAYFTDSFRAVLYRVPLSTCGQVPDQSDVKEVELGGAYEHVADSFNANGIDAPTDGEYLIIVNSTTGLLYTVDPASGEAAEIDLGGETLTNGDGILLDCRTLYVVQNQLNRIAVVRLKSGATRGDVVDEITDPEFDVPTTIAEFGRYLYAVNARFGNPDPENAEYSVIRVSKR